MPNIRLTTLESDYNRLISESRAELQRWLREMVASILAPYGVTISDVDSMWITYKEGQNTIPLQIEIITEPEFDHHPIPPETFAHLAERVLTWIRQTSLASIFESKAVWIRIHANGSIWLDTLSS